MALLSALAKARDELVKLGYPEEVAENIVSGRLDMRSPARSERQQDLNPDIFYTGTTSPDIINTPPSRNEIGTGVSPQFLFGSKSPALAASYAGKKQGRFADESPTIYPFAIDTTGFDRLLGDRNSWNALENPRIELGGDPENIYISPGIGYHTDDIAQMSYELGSPGLLMQDVIDPGPYTKLMRMGLQGKKENASQFEFDNFLRGLEQAPPTNVVVPDTTRVRSLFGAAFDPEYKGSNILGGTAAGALGLTALMAPEEAEAKTPEFLASLPQLEPYEPGMVETAVQNVAQYLKDIGATESDYTANQMASSLSNLADFTPVVGDAKGFAETRDLIEEGSYGQAAVSGLLAALGLIPIGGDIAAAALKGALPLPFSVNRDTGLLQRVGDPESVNTMKLDVDPGVDLVPNRLLSAEDLEGRGFVSGMADTSRGDLSRVVAVNDQPVDMVRFGGQDYMRQPQNVEKGVLWASDAGAVTGLSNAAKAASQLPGVSRSPLYIPYQMGGASTDFATMTSDIMVPIARQNMKKADKKALDKRIRQGAGTKTGEFKPQPDWPGIDSPKADEWLANAGGNRKAVTKAIDEYRDVAGINLSQARAAIVDPNQLTPRVGNLRQAGVLDLMKPARPGIHPSYNTDLMGSYLGEFGEGANLLSDLNPLIRSSKKPFVPEMTARGHNLEAAALPAPVGKAMQAGLIGAFDQATLDELIKKGLIAP
jgi:hypothetical protein